MRQLQLRCVERQVDDAGADPERVGARARRSSRRPSRPAARVGHARRRRSRVSPGGDAGPARSRPASAPGGRRRSPARSAYTCTTCLPARSPRFATSTLTVTTSPAPAAAGAVDAGQRDVGVAEPVAEPVRRRGVLPAARRGSRCGCPRRSRARRRPACVDSTGTSASRPPARWWAAARRARRRRAARRRRRRRTPGRRSSRRSTAATSSRHGSSTGEPALTTHDRARVGGGDGARPGRPGGRAGRAMSRS